MLGYVVSVGVKVLIVGCHRGRSQGCPVTKDTAQATVEPHSPNVLLGNLSKGGKQHSSWERR